MQRARKKKTPENSTAIDLNVTSLESDEKSGEKNSATPVESNNVQDSKESLQVRLLKGRIATLELAYTSQPSYLNELVEAHRELIAYVPEDVSATDALMELKSAEINKVLALSTEGNTEAALARLNQIGQLFPEITAEEVTLLEKKVENIPKISTILESAQQYENNNALISPSGANALESYQTILTIDEKNDQAREGIERVINKLTASARIQIKAGQYQIANQVVEKILTIAPEHSGALQLKQQINSVVSNRARLSNLIDTGNAQLGQGNLFLPANQNAFFYFNQVLKDDPENELASLGVQKTIDAVSTRVWDFIREEKFDLAKNQLIAPLEAMPDNPRLLSLSIAIDEAIAEKIFSRQPRVSQLLVKASMFNEVEGVQSELFEPGSIVYVGFRYENFNTEYATLEAILLEDETQAQIAHVSVEITGKSGSAFFQINRPVLKFSPGSYTIVMQHGASNLITSTFNVVD